MKAKELYDLGQLNQAITAMTDEVKAHPTDTSRRGFLCELLCFAGELERVDKQLDLLGDQDPGTMLGISLFRHLVRAEQARQQFYTEGRVPEFVDQPTEVLKLHLEASILLREGKTAEAGKLLAEAETKRPRVSGVCDGKPFDEFRDLDDLTAPFMEVLTSNGKYYWVPMERIELIEFRAPKRPRDLYWRAAHMIIKDGPDGEVYLPTIYQGTHKTTDDLARLGRATDWHGAEGGPIRGFGLRTLLIGTEDHTLLELKNVTINT